MFAFHIRTNYDLCLKIQNDYHFKIIKALQLYKSVSAMKLLKIHIKVYAEHCPLTPYYGDNTIIGLLDSVGHKPFSS